MPKIAVVCAFNRRNAGMYSVDLAAMNYFGNLGIDHCLFLTQTEPRRGSRHLRKFGLSAGNRSVRRFGKLHYRLLRGARDLDGFTHLVYWGDFQNNPVYGTNDYIKRDLRYALADSEQAAFQRWLELHTGNVAPPGLHVLSIGQNFQHSLDLSDDRIVAGIESLAKNVSVFMPRDSVSMNNLRKYVGTDTESAPLASQGLDCAFLLEPSSEIEVENQFGWFFSRSRLPEVQLAIQELEYTSGLESRPIGEWIGLSPKTAHRQFERMMAVMSKSRFVVTDTYHVAVNALRIGVPTFCIGRPDARQEGTTGDYKKKILFADLDLNDSYLEFDEQDEAGFPQFLKERIQGIHLSYPGRAEIRDKVAEKVKQFHEQLNDLLIN
jgi:hypothetical protein